MKQDFRNTKIRIKSEEHSKAFQKAVFEAGGWWVSSGKVYKQNMEFIFVDKDLILTYADNATYFEKQEYMEIQFTS